MLFRSQFTNYERVVGALGQAVQHSVESGNYITNIVVEDRYKVKIAKER